ncbi:unnamed protein product [Adineta ricciae]|uniref:Uncharacterized protein n=1 Tax=Adineta ricciae TaxID=249248 RepID=A0A814GJX9_ADIRI|nr:unnamed protein product [Adineta ricciae]CAF1228696.1 unnamed protein product [Adineta ricciae]
MLDDFSVRLVNDQPIRLLLFAEAVSNLSLILFVYFYPGTFLAFLLRPVDEITPLTTYILSWWNSWLFIITGLMFAAVPSKYNTPTLTAGLIHVRRFIYWGLLASEILLIYHLLFARYRTVLSIVFCIFLVAVCIGRLIVLFPRQAWFGTVLIEISSDKMNKQQ